MATTSELTNSALQIGDSDYTKLEKTGVTIYKNGVGDVVTVGTGITARSVYNFADQYAEVNGQDGFYYSDSDGSSRLTTRFRLKEWTIKQNASDELMFAYDD